MKKPYEKAHVAVAGYPSATTHVEATALYTQKVVKSDVARS